MNYLRVTLISMAAAVAATLAFAGGASAQSIELVEESTGEHCPPVVLNGTEVTGGCEGHAVSEGDVRLEVFGSLVSVCQLEFNGHMDEDGNGYVDDMVLTGPNCTTPPCEAANGDEIPWPLELGEPSPGMIEGEAAFCVTSAALGQINCHVTSIGFTFTEHSKREDWNQAPCESPMDFFHLTGSGATEELDAELIHL